LITCQISHIHISISDYIYVDTFEAGVARDGWFTNKHLVTQFESNVEILKAQHPRDGIIICFDNSMPHRAKAPDALDMSMLKKDDGIAGEGEL
jgi:hypothetical protein